MSSGSKTSWEINKVICGLEVVAEICETSLFGLYCKLHNSQSHNPQASPSIFEAVLKAGFELLKSAEQTGIITVTHLPGRGYITEVRGDIALTETQEQLLQEFEAELEAAETKLHAIATN